MTQHQDSPRQGQALVPPQLHWGSLWGFAAHARSLLVPHCSRVGCDPSTASPACPSTREHPPITRPRRDSEVNALPDPPAHCSPLPASPRPWGFYSFNERKFPGAAGSGDRRTFAGDELTWQLAAELEGSTRAGAAMGCAPSVYTHPLGHRVPVGKGAWVTAPGSRILAPFHVAGCQLDTSPAGDV